VFILGENVVFTGLKDYAPPFFPMKNCLSCGCKSIFDKSPLERRKLALTQYHSFHMPKFRGNKRLGVFRENRHGISDMAKQFFFFGDF